MHVLAPVTVGTRTPEILWGGAAAAAVSMVRRFLHAAQEALGCLVLHLERGLSFAASVSRSGALEAIGATSVSPR